MQIGRCPICHHRLDLQTMAQDEASSALLGLLARLSTPLGHAVLGYLGLFRAEHRDLANDRALRLAQEVLDLTSDQHLLTAALVETTEAIRSKRQTGDRRPLKNHNYLGQVMQGVADRVGQAVPKATEQPHSPQKEPVHADTMEAWRRQMERLGRDPDKLLRGGQ